MEGLGKREREHRKVRRKTVGYKEKEKEEGKEEGLEQGKRRRSRKEKKEKSRIETQE
jgi:hypothetical protein